jgi:energy-coupling factor transporter transmembrane protein EcfT
MLSNFALGVYYPGNSLVHRLQARTKLILLAWFVIWLVVAHRFFWHFAPSVVVLGFSFGGLIERRYCSPWTPSLLLQ